MADKHLAKELCKRIEESSIPPDELAMLISNSFGHGHMPPDSREVMWGESEGTIALRLVYTKAGRFTAYAESALTDETAETLIRQIETLEAGGDPTVWRKVCFALLPVVGFFRYRDLWQLRPVPPDAPQPPFVMAPHPFILEVKGGSVAERFVGWMRGGKLLWETELILSLLLLGGIDSYGSASHEWVIDMGRDSQEPEPRTVLGQVGYSLPTMPGPPDDFSPVDGLDPLALAPSAEYLRERGITVGDKLEIPDLMPIFCDTLAAASPLTRERFFRAAFWFSRSHRAWRLSRSLSYISLINSLEVLTMRADHDPCPTCGLNRAPGPTSRFRALIEEHAITVPERDRKELYALRSRLVHGDQLLIGDTPSGWGFTPQDAEERWRHDQASGVARIVLISWLSRTVSDEILERERSTGS